jgi:hypothetical protein
MDSLPKIAKPEDLARVCHQVAERAARILSDFAKRCPQPGAASDELGIAKPTWTFTRACSPTRWRSARMR